MSKSTDKSSSPGGSGNKRSSFSLSNTFGSVRRAISSGSKKPEKSGEFSGGLADNNPFGGPPPAYTLTAGESGQTPEKTFTPEAPNRSMSIFSRIRQSDDELHFLAEFDTMFLIDDSHSMSWNAMGQTIRRHGEMSRWDETRSVIEQIVPVCMKRDGDGIDIYFLNDSFQLNFYQAQERLGWKLAGDREQGKASHAYIGVREVKHVRTIFNGRSPAHGTPTGERLGDIMKTYVTCYANRFRDKKPAPKPLNIIVITDGDANNRQLLRENLIEEARRLDELGAPYHQLGVQFFQVGKDERAAEFLRDLDDNLGKYRQNEELRDIVDCVTYDQLSQKAGSTALTSDAILKVVLGAVLKHLDRQKMKGGKLPDPV